MKESTAFTVSKSSLLVCLQPARSGFWPYLSTHAAFSGSTLASMLANPEAILSPQGPRLSWLITPSSPTPGSFSHLLSPPLDMGSPQGSAEQSIHLSAHIPIWRLKFHLGQNGHLFPHKPAPVRLSIFKMDFIRDFPAGSVAKIPCSQHRVPGFNPWLGN